MNALRNYVATIDFNEIIRKAFEVDTQGIFVLINYKNFRCTVNLESYMFKQGRYDFELNAEYKGQTHRHYLFFYSKQDDIKNLESRMFRKVIRAIEDYANIEAKLKARSLFAEEEFTNFEDAKSAYEADCSPQNESVCDDCLATINAVNAMTHKTQHLSEALADAEEVFLAAMNEQFEDAVDEYVRDAEKSEILAKCEVLCREKDTLANE